MSSNTVYLVSGANRGIGLGLVTALAQRANTIVFAGARDPASAKDLQALAKAHPGKVHVVQLTSGDKADNEAAAALIKKVAGHIDVVIANAAISTWWGPVHEAPVEEVRKHFDVNAIGPLVLFQALYGLLKEATLPKFVVISTVGGTITIGATFPLGLAAYGTSKAAVNYLTRKINGENEGLIAFALHPGVVSTETAKALVEQVPALGSMPSISVEESVKGIIARVDEATREETGGTFIGYDGAKYPW
ncbi:hypothetical protein PLICRDRAFT_154202 [Plicaturopsis crispa FD-325 SS-3]|nr:hypothetical protein PLICRDRAFT_154202 [Plicaturopsis crispa FD-325 SS-3]